MKLNGHRMKSVDKPRTVPVHCISSLVVEDVNTYLYVAARCRGYISLLTTTSKPASQARGQR